MYEEKRNFPRFNTHISMGLMIAGHAHQNFGYIENLSAGGMGVVTLDYMEPGTQISGSFFLPETLEKVNAVATVVHAKKSVEMIYYHGLRFDFLRDRDRVMLHQFLNRETLRAS